jgi:hypothetical protein
MDGSERNSSERILLDLQNEDDEYDDEMMGQLPHHKHSLLPPLHCIFIIVSAFYFMKLKGYK